MAECRKKIEPVVVAAARAAPVEALGGVYVCGQTRTRTHTYTLFGRNATYRKLNDRLEYECSHLYCRVYIKRTSLLARTHEHKQKSKIVSIERVYECVRARSRLSLGDI